MGKDISVRRWRWNPAELQIEPADGSESVWWTTAAIIAEHNAVVAEIERQVEQIERLWLALEVAGQLADEINGVDLYDAAFDIYVARIGEDDGGDPSPRDYAEAFVAAAKAAGGDDG